MTDISSLVNQFLDSSAAAGPSELTPEQAEELKRLADPVRRYEIEVAKLRGAPTMSMAEHANEQASYSDYVAKYGEAQAAALISQAAEIRHLVQSQAEASPGFWRGAGDYVNTAVQGANSLGGDIAATAAAPTPVNMANPVTGFMLAQDLFRRKLTGDTDPRTTSQRLLDQTQSTNKWINQGHSAEYLGRKEIRDALTRINARYREQAYQTPDGSVRGFLAEQGTGAIHAVEEFASDPFLAGDDVAGAAPSLAVSGGIGGLVRKQVMKEAGAKAAAASLAAGESAEVAKLAQIGAAKLAAPAARETAERVVVGANTLMEASSQQQATYQALKELPQEVWDKDPEYQALLAQEVDPEMAKHLVMQQQMNVATSAAIPGALLSSLLVKKFEADPLQFKGIGTTLRNMSTEWAEETGQGVSGQFATNVGVRGVDPNQSLTEDLGHAGAQSGLVGLGLAGAAQSPAIVANTASLGRDATKLGATAIGKTAMFAASPILNKLGEKADAKETAEVQETMTKAAAAVDSLIASSPAQDTASVPAQTVTTAKAQGIDLDPNDVQGARDILQAKVDEFTQAGDEQNAGAAKQLMQTLPIPATTTPVPVAQEVIDAAQTAGITLDPSDSVTAKQSLLDQATTLATAGDQAAADSLTAIANQIPEPKPTVTLQSLVSLNQDEQAKAKALGVEVNANNRVQALQQVHAHVAAQKKAGKRTADLVDEYLLMNDMSDNLKLDTISDDVFNALTANDPKIQEIIDKIGEEIGNVIASPAVQKIRQTLIRQAQSKQVQADAVSANPAVNTVKLMGAVATIDPASMTAAAIDNAIKHSDMAGLTADQKDHLTFAQKLFKEQEAHITRSRESGDTSLRTKISEEITSGEDNAKDNTGNQSAHQFFKEILSHIRGGNLVAAKDKMDELRKFTESAHNKVNAINQSYANGGGKATASKVQVMDKKTRAMKDSAREYGITINSPESVAVAAEIESDGQFLTEIYNAIANQHPELGAKPIEHTTLHKDIQARAKQNVKTGALAKARAEAAKKKVETVANKPATEISAVPKSEATVTTEEVEAPIEFETPANRAKRQSAAGKAVTEQNKKLATPNTITTLSKEAINKFLGSTKLGLAVQVYVQEVLSRTTNLKVKVASTELLTQLAAVVDQIPESSKKWLVGIKLMELDPKDTRRGTSISESNTIALRQDDGYGTRYGIGGLLWALAHELGHIHFQRSGAEAKFLEQLKDKVFRHAIRQELKAVSEKYGDSQHTIFTYLHSLVQEGQVQRQSPEMYQELPAELFALRMLNEEQFNNEHPIAAKWFKDNLSEPTSTDQTDSPGNTGQGTNETANAASDAGSQEGNPSGVASVPDIPVSAEEEITSSEIEEDLAQNRAQEEDATAPSTIVLEEPGTESSITSPEVTGTTSVESTQEHVQPILQRLLKDNKGKTIFDYVRRLGKTVYMVPRQIMVKHITSQEDSRDPVLKQRFADLVQKFAAHFENHLQFEYNQAMSSDSMYHLFTKGKWYNTGSTAHSQKNPFQFRLMQEVPGGFTPFTRAMDLSEDQQKDLATTGKTVFEGTPVSIRIVENAKKSVALDHEQLKWFTKSVVPASLYYALTVSKDFYGSRYPKQLALMVKQPNGSHRHDPYLTNSAVYAALSVMSNQSRSMPRSVEDIAKKAEDGNEKPFRPILPKGVNRHETFYASDVVAAVQQELMSFLGITDRSDIPEGIAQGALGSLAAQAVEALATFHVLTDVRAHEDLADEATADGKTLPNIKRNHFVALNPTSHQVFDALQGFDYLAQAVQAELPNRRYIGEAPPTAKKMLRSPVENTPHQEQAIQANNQIPHKHNPMMGNVFESMGEEGVISLFGNPITKEEKELMNVEDLKAREGKNSGLLNAIREAKARMDEASTIAKVLGVAVDALEHFWAFNHSTVMRLQMQGNYTPQGSKVMRELFLPTASTIDATTGLEQTGYFLALAQMMGVKVHQMDFKQSREKVQAIFDAHPEALNILREKGVSSKKMTADELKIVQKAVAAGGGEIMALHALADYAKFTSPGYDQTKHSTQVYLEADGVSNGVANTNVIWSAGQFSGNDFANLARGGMFLIPGMTMNKFRASTPLGQTDLYTAAAQYASQADLNKRQTYGVYLAMYLGMEVQIDKNQVIISRKDIKRPSQMVIYGGQAHGISKHLVKEMRKVLLGRLSKALIASHQNGTTWQSEMFPDFAGAGRTSTEVFNEFHALWHNELGNPAFAEMTAEQARQFNPRLKGMKALVEILQHSLATMIQKGTESVITHSAKRNVGLIQTVTQLQSIAFAHDYQKRVDEITEARGYGLGMSQKEKQDIFKELLEKYPLVNYGLQSYLIVASKPSQSGKRYGATFSGKFSADSGNEVTYGSSGVKSSPYLNIGLGDGLMMQLAATMSGASNRVLRIFDGVNLPIDEIFTQSQVANEAVAQTWLMNPVTPIRQAFESSIDGIETLLSEIDEHRNQSDVPHPRDAELIKMWESYAKNRNEDPEVYIGMGFNSLRSVLQQIQEQLAHLDHEMQATKNAWQRIHFEVDQMASAQATYKHQGEMLLTEEEAKEYQAAYLDNLPTDPTKSWDAGPEHALYKKMADRFNTIYKEELAKLGKADELSTDRADSILQPILDKVAENQKAREERPKSNRALDRAIKALATVQARIAPYLVTKTSVMALLKSLSSAWDKSDPRNKVIKVLAQMKVFDSGYAVIAGTREELAKAGYNISKFESGITDPVNKVIALVTDTTEEDAVETIIHEGLHIATFQQLYSYFKDPEANKHMAPIVENLQQLMKELSSTEQNSLVNYFTQDIQQLLNQMNNNAELSVRTFTEDMAAQQAARLSEFISWSLSNKQLVDYAQTMAPSGMLTSLKKIIDSAVDMFKSLVGLKQPAIKNLFDQILYNTKALTQVIPAVEALAPTEGLLYRSNDVESPKLDKMAATYTNLRQKALDYETQVNNKTPQDLVVGSQATASFAATLFDLSPQQQEVMENILMYSTTTGLVPSGVLTKVAAVFEGVIPNLTWESFTDNPTDPNAQNKALQQYRFITGVNSHQNSDGKTMIVPTFLALAAVSPQVQKILETFQVKGKQKISASTWLENSAEWVADKVDESLAGSSKEATNALEILNSIQNSILNSKPNVLLQMAGEAADTVQGMLEVGNESTSNLLDKSAQYLAKKSLDVTDGQAEFIETGGKIVAAVFNSISKSRSGAVAKSLEDTLGSMDVWPTVRRLMSDVVGRTEFNGAFLELMKKTRSLISATRNNANRDLPQQFKNAFKKIPTEKQWTLMTRALMRSNLMAINGDNETAFSLLDRNIRQDRKNKLIQNVSPKALEAVKALADYLATGVPKNVQYRNAHAISQKLGGDIDTLNTLIAIYSLDHAQEPELSELQDIVRTEPTAMKFVFDYAQRQNAMELEKALKTPETILNHWAGYIPNITNETVAMEFAPLAEAKKYAKLSMFPQQTVSTAYGTMAYFVGVAPIRQRHNQGVLQTITPTNAGVDFRGYTQHNAVARYTSPKEVSRLSKNTPADLSPVYDKDGEVVAYERLIDPNMQALRSPEMQMHKLLGNHTGRLVEERYAREINQAMKDLIDHKWHTRVESNTPDIAFTNIHDIKDPVIRAGIDMLPLETKQLLMGKDLKQPLMVHKSLLEDVFGYRDASIGDLWTGNTRIPPKVAETISNNATALFGVQTYQRLVRAEDGVKRSVSLAKNNIVVRSVVVMVSNYLSGRVQLLGRNVPLSFSEKRSFIKAREIEKYGQMRIERQRLETLIVTSDSLTVTKLQARIRAIDEAIQSLSIYPLLQAGEFTSMTSAELDEDDRRWLSGKWAAAFDKVAGKTPEPVKTLARNLVVDESTALYKLLHKGVQYGDFINKSIYYDHLVINKKLSSEQALAKVTDEFVNFDRLPGRGRGYLESIGLMWFWNFKLRAMKAGVSMLREQPLTTLLVAALLPPKLLGMSIGTPLTDSAMSVGIDRLMYSVGPEMLFDAPEMNYIIELLN